MSKIVCDFSTDIAQTGEPGYFYRYKIDDKVMIWFSDNLQKDEYYISQIHSSILDKTLSGFEIYIEVSEKDFYYKCVRVRTPSISGTVDDLQEQIKNIEIISEICKTIDDFFKNEYPHIRNKHQGQISKKDN